MKIAFVDSGVGGLLFAIDFLQACKKNGYYFDDTEILHFGDTKNFPYGLNTAQKIQSDIINLINTAVSYGCEVIIVACNTASTVITEEIIVAYKNRGIELIVIIKQSAVRLVESLNKNFDKSVAIFGTPHTIASGRYQEAIFNISDGKIKVESYAPSSIELGVEAGMNTEQLRSLILNEMESFCKKIGSEAVARLGAIGLFCTHYGCIKPLIFDYFHGLGVDVEVLSQGEIFAMQIILLIKTAKSYSHQKANITTLTSYVTGANTINFSKVVRDIMPSDFQFHVSML